MHVLRKVPPTRSHFRTFVPVRACVRKGSCCNPILFHPQARAFLSAGGALFCLPRLLHADVVDETDKVNIVRPDFTREGSVALG